MKKICITKKCRALILFFAAIIAGISCRKEHNNTTNAGSKLVQSVWSKIHRSDSSGGFDTGVDSFIYDSQKRIITITAISYDSIFTTDANGNVLPGLVTTQGTTLISYTGSNSLPDKFTESFITNGRPTAPRTFYLYYNNLSQLIKDSTSTNIITHFTYSAGLITMLTNFGNTLYSIDTNYVDAGNNVTTNILGGNFFLDSNNNPVYGRFFYYTETYSNILNPFYPNISLSIISLAQSSTVTTKLLPLTKQGENYSTGPNGIITTKEMSQYQYTVGANNLIQSSVDIINGDMQKWYYY